MSKLPHCALFPHIPHFDVFKVFFDRTPEVLSFVDSTGHGRNACGLQTFVADWFYLCELSMVCCSFVEKNISPQEKVWLLGFTSV